MGKSFVPAPERVRKITALAFAVLYLIAAALLTLQRARLYEERLDGNAGSLLLNTTNEILQRERYDESFTHAESTQRLVEGMVEGMNRAKGAFWEPNRDFAYSVAQYYDAEKKPLFNTVCMLLIFGEGTLEYVPLQVEPDYAALRDIYAQRNRDEQSEGFVDARVQGFRSRQGLILPQTVTIGSLVLTYGHQPGEGDEPVDIRDSMLLCLPTKNPPGKLDVQRLQALCALSAEALAESDDAGTISNDLWRYKSVYAGIDPFKRAEAQGGPQGYYTTSVLAFPLLGALYFMLPGCALLLLCFAAAWAVTNHLIFRKKEGQPNA